MKTNIQRDWKRVVGLLLLVPAFTQTAVAQAQSGKGVIAGRIPAQIGAAVESVRIAAVDVNDTSGTLVSIAVTDASGQYRLENIPPGEYRIIAGALASPTYYPGTQNVNVAKTVAVKAGATITGIDFSAVLVPARFDPFDWVSISGHFIRAGGESLPQSTKDLVVSWGLGPSHEAGVHPDGTFAISVVAIERYGVKFAAGSSGNLVDDLYLQSLTYCQRDLLKEALTFDPACPGIVATLAPGIQITGTVRKENGDPANMTLFLIPRVPRSQRPDLPRKTVTDADGRFVLHGVAPGEYSLSSEIELHPIWRPATVTAGRETVTPIDLVLKSDGSLTPAR